MRCFKIPLTRLDLFLIALNMNFDVHEVDWVFKMTGYYDVVIMKIPNKATEKNIEVFAQRLWTTSLAEGTAFESHYHNGLCDLDEKTLKTKVEIKKGEYLRICMNCMNRLPERPKQQRNER